jgi:ribonuclease P protein component
VGSAVERNRAKRLLREAARQLYPSFETRGWDMMLIARPKLVEVKEREVKQALASLLDRAES